jgi:hypothetical protein
VDQGRFRGIAHLFLSEPHGLGKSSWTPVVPCGHEVVRAIVEITRAHRLEDLLQLRSIPIPNVRICWQGDALRSGLNRFAAQQRVTVFGDSLLNLAKFGRDCGIVLLFLSFREPPINHKAEGSPIEGRERLGLVSPTLVSTSPPAYYAQLVPNQDDRRARPQPPRAQAVCHETARP